MSDLTHGDGRRILRYWLAVIREEEALSGRPIARQPPRGDGVVDVAHPRPGHDYFKVRDTQNAAGFMLHTTGALALALNAERAAFCEHVLHGRRKALRYNRTETTPQTWLVGFPVIYFPRRRELATLLRFRTDVEWRTADGKRFDLLKAQAHSEPPIRVRLSRQEVDEEQTMPYALDATVLGRTLGISEEDLAEFANQLHGGGGTGARRAVAAITALLKADGCPEALPESIEEDDATLFTELVDAIQARLIDGSAQVHPVALVYDAGRIMATWHLQRDMRALMKRSAGEAPFRKGNPLQTYLLGAQAVVDHSPLRGIFGPHNPTDSQRAAATQTLGSRLTAIQGPPGTGKTRLIRDLAAHAIVERARAVVGRGQMANTQTVVVSTNNRAVDQALDPLADATLPLALRTGNQQITANVSITTLNRTLNWLHDQPEESGWDDAVAAFKAAHSMLDEALTPHLEVWKLEKRGRTLKSRLAALPAPTKVDESEEIRDALRTAGKKTRRLAQRLVGLQRRVGDRAKADVLQAEWGRTKTEHFAALQTSLKALDLSLTIDLPPTVDDDEDMLDAWGDAVANAHDAVLDLAANLNAQRLILKQLDERRSLVLELDELPPSESLPDTLDPLRRAAFITAVEVRKAWARKHRLGLIKALERALKILHEVPSFRRVAREDRDTADWLRQLYPVLGCTLLSLGNLAPPDPERFAQVIIDEAGQCHPAYALAGLLRADQALIIGDVHQLEPVIELSADDEARVTRRVGELDSAKYAPYRVQPDAQTSAQSLADRCLTNRPVLRDHFRCHPEIIAISDSLCSYDLRVVTPARPVVRALGQPVRFRVVRGSQVRVRGSWRNDAEIEAVVALITALSQRGITPDQIAILTPYVGQLEGLRRELRTLNLLSDELAMGTVHRFQGGERPIVIFSTVVTEPRSLVFLNRRVNLINVAVSRAQDHLVIVGHPEILAQGTYTAALVHQSWVSTN